MPILRNPARRSARATSVVALLVVALALVGALTYQAQDAARSHREAAEAALGDYAAFAAWEYARLANQELHYNLWNLVRPVYYMELPAGGRLPSQAELAGLFGKLGYCECPYRPRFWFAVDLETGDLNVSGPDPHPELAAWIQTAVREHALTRWGEKWEQATLVSDVGGARRAVTYVLKRNPEGDPQAAYGFELGLGLFQSVLRQQFQQLIRLALWWL